ncbi:MarR family transcriptional regulator [Aminipila butyrica]|uniref:HTH-type transcriptional regulator SarZ n=1 Tax=Aminipila butyrica TaxID=433296 RepID=A0A858BQA6_9FIRM|nr:MarR family transcriptional regulator [Aminipila butyrica]QIB67983.1 MarR family transcriptional regulator [Aminipila butyrica]
MEEKNNYDRLKLENQLCFPLYACARKVVNRYTPYLKPLGITYTQYLVFLVLWEQDGLTVGELGQKLYLDNGTLTPLLKKMEAAGHITRTRSKEDERVVQVFLTPEGRNLREEAKDIPAKMQECLSVSPEQAKQLYQLLYEVLNMA